VELNPNNYIILKGKCQIRDVTYQFITTTSHMRALPSSDNQGLQNWARNVVSPVGRNGLNA